MKKILLGLIGLGFMILIASAYTITRLKLQAQAPVDLALVGTENPSELIKIEKTIEHVKSEIAEVESLEKKIQTARLDEALSLGVELNQKIKSYGSIATLQANLRMLNELKEDFRTRLAQDLKTSANENL